MGESGLTDRAESTSADILWLACRESHARQVSHFTLISIRRVILFNLFFLFAPLRPLGVKALWRPTFSGRIVVAIYGNPMPGMPSMR